MAADGPIRILRIIARLNVGGPALHVSYLTRHLDERGYETALIAGRVGADEGSMEYAARELGIEPILLEELQREISLLDDVRAVVRLRRLIRELRPHVVHTHTAKAGAVGRVAALLAGSARPPVIVHTFHGHVLRGYFSPHVTTVFRWVERVLAQRTDALVAVSAEVRDELVDYGIAPQSRFRVVRLGLDLGTRTAAPPGTREEERRALGIAGDAYVVAWLGRMTEIKRVDVLLRAVALLAEHVPSAHAILAGGGPLELARELGIDDVVHFVGMRPDVAAVLAAADVVALSSANEGTPVSLIEALAAGRPAVSADVGGVRDVVAHDETGLLVPPLDAGALADALTTLAKDPARRARLGERARADVRERYSVERLVDDVDRLYRELLARGAAGGVQAPRPTLLTPTLPSLRVGRAPRTLRILLVSQYFPPEVGATQSRMQAFAEYLASRGHDVTVICEFPNHPHGVIPPHYRGRLFEDDRSNPYRILRVWVKANEEKTQRTRMAFYLSYMAMATAMAPLAGRADVVFATTPPLFTGLAGLALARLNRAPLVLDVRDLWPAAAVSLQQIAEGPQLRAAELMERRLYRAAAAVAAVTRPFCEHIDRIRARPPQTTLLPNGTLDLFLEAAPDGARDQLGVAEDAFLVTFAGTHGIAQGLGSVLDAAPALEGVAELVFVGDGPVKDALVRDASDRGLGNVTFHPQVPLEETPPILAASDALLVPLSSHPTFRDFVPSKMIDAMATGRPVILSAAGEAARLLEVAGAGVAVPPEDARALANAIRSLRERPEEARAMGERGREFARKRLRSVQAERLEQVLLDVTEAT